MVRIRALAAASDKWLRAAPAVMLPASRMFRYRRRSIRSKCMGHLSGSVIFVGAGLPAKRPLGFAQISKSLSLASQLLGRYGP